MEVLVAVLEPVVVLGEEERKEHVVGALKGLVEGARKEVEVVRRELGRLVVRALRVLGVEAGLAVGVGLVGYWFKLYL